MNTLQNKWLYENLRWTECACTGERKSEDVSSRGDGDDISKLMDEIVKIARDLELEVNEDDIEELVM